MSIKQKIKLFFFREKKLMTNFFEGFNFQKGNRKIKLDILTWVYKLKSKGICINKFSDLWKDCEEIIFPITVFRVESTILKIELRMEDSKGIIWYVTINTLYEDMLNYDIEMKTEDMDLWWQCKAS